MQSTQAWSAIFRRRVSPTMFEITRFMKSGERDRAVSIHHGASIRAERFCFKTDRHARRIWCLEYRCPLFRRRQAHPWSSRLPL